MIAAALLFVLLAAAVLLIAQGSRSRRERARMLAQLRRDGEAQAERVERLSRAVSESARQMAGMSGALEARMDALTRTNDEKLAEMRRTVGEKLDSRLSESFRVVNGQLADVHRGLGEMRELADNVTDLKKVLGNVKTRGVWGEVLLGNVLSQMFSPEQYIENAQIPAGSATRVEFALKLPARDREAVLLPIDSKFPQEDYLRLAEAEASDDTGGARTMCKTARARGDGTGEADFRQIHSAAADGGFCRNVPAVGGAVRGSSAHRRADRAHAGQIPRADLRPINAVRAAHEPANGLSQLRAGKAQRRSTGAL